MPGVNLTREEALEFAAKYDPQPFHMDEEAAKQSHFGALCASGWQTASIWMRLYVLYAQKNAQVLENNGQPVAQMGPGLGMKNLRWLKPVYAGDTLHYYTTIIAKRPSESRPKAWWRQGPAGIQRGRAHGGTTVRRSAGRA